tara:strand:+ start:8 stop:1318 length:1311 start_codon:yes stop_codon:yes gene_type:complete
MNELINSLELKDIIKELKNNNYLTALGKTEALYKKYPNDKILIKLFASIYFNLGEWEKALKYYKNVLNFENEKFKIYCNIGVSYFKLGKINKSIIAFKEAINDNPKFDIAYDNLGISYLELGKHEDAIQNFIISLNLNGKNYSSIKNLINSLHLFKPKNKNNHVLVKLDDQISNIVNNYKIKNFYDEKNIKLILEKSNEFINNLENNIFTYETQIFRKNLQNLNCSRHFKVFNKFNIIPKYCFACYKVIFHVSNVVNLIKLYFLFDNLNLKNNNIRKCIVETRKNIEGNYKGYIYCKGLKDAQEVYKNVKEIVVNENLKDFKISIKHGCSEYYKIFPEFEKINFNGEQKFKYNKSWETKEKLIDDEEPSRLDMDKKIYSESIKGLSLLDVLIINNWINYAKITGDHSYKSIYKKKINISFLNNILKDQLNFRSKII